MPLQFAERSEELTTAEQTLQEVAIVAAGLFARAGLSQKVATKQSLIDWVNAAMCALSYCHYADAFRRLAAAIEDRLASEAQVRFSIL